jgi:hypothetical protein
MLAMAIVFISYSPADQRLFDLLDKHLTTLRRENPIEWFRAARRCPF